MKRALIILFGVIALAALNYGVYEKEKILSNGETVFLELRPVDPRSLLQGDYMRLRYALEAKVKIPSGRSHGQAVINTDENNVAKFVRFHQGEPLQQGEKLMRYNKRYTNMHIKPDSFLFQEGHGKLYERAKYGVFKFDKSSDYLLIGLADKNRVLISPK